MGASGSPSTDMSGTASPSTPAATTTTQ
jgi:hypothetical protein